MFKVHARMPCLFHQISLPSIFLDGFLGFLQYIYTDDVDFQRHDPIEVMKVANQFCCPRLLTLCEINLEKKMESSLASCKKKSEKLGELIELITTSQVILSLICLLSSCEFTLVKF